MNMFRIKSVQDLGGGYIMLVLSHLYGSGPEVKIPISGDAAAYPIGATVDVTCTAM